VPLLCDDVPLVLGSQSPRRREILTSLRVPFVVCGAHVDERVRGGERVEVYLARIVRAKLEGVRAIAPPGRAILVADTTVVLDGAILGKPANVAEAGRMIARLAGRAHEVKTRFAIAAEARVHEETMTTVVTFRPLSESEIRAYAESGEGLDKAGAYAVQGLGAGIVSRISGSYTNVVGLPACEVVVALTALELLPA
jgi:septum formation protein